jgi:pimeloyl-ACP methyl ester carboxylesterase
MKRPVMDPMFVQDHKHPPRFPMLRKVVVSGGRAVLWFGKLLIRQPFSVQRKGAAPESASGKLVRGLFYRLMFAPILVSGLSAVVVFLATHPIAHVPPVDPSSQGVYFDPISFKSEDGTELQGWLVSVVDARRVVLQRDRLLRSSNPAVVLVHDFAQSPHQMLPLLAPLHEDGLVVVAVGLRGVGVSRTPKAQTFGLDEAIDVNAAVEYLRHRPFVDANRIGVLGIGTGANAAMIAAAKDPRIAALCLADPLESPGDAITRYIGPNRPGLRWLQNVNRWAFQVIYRVDMEDMSLSRAALVAQSRPVLRLNGQTLSDGKFNPGATEVVRNFFRDNLRNRGKQADKPADKSVATTNGN